MHFSTREIKLITVLKLLKQLLELRITERRIYHRKIIAS